MTIRSPITGRVLDLTAQPRRFLSSDPTADRDSSTVFTIYDPSKLQVRVDVRLDDLKLVQLGQQVRISTPASDQALIGHVLAISTPTGAPTNTLEVKIGIDQP